MIRILINFLCGKENQKIKDALDLIENKKDHPRNNYIIRRKIILLARRPVISKLQISFQKMNLGRWTNNEHKLYTKGVILYDRDFKKISEYIGSRTLIQVRTHDQKYRCKRKHQDKMKVLYTAVLFYNSY